MIRFGEVVAQLPQGSSFDIWQSFLERLSPLCASLSGDDSSVSRLWCLYGIFEKLLQNQRVSPEALTEPSVSRLVELMDRTDSALLRPLFEAALQHKEDELLLSSSLLLAHRWGELRIPLALCGAGRAGLDIPPALVSHPHDLTLVLPMLSAKQWSRLHKRVAKSDNCCLQFLWDLLNVQKVRAAVLFLTDHETREATLTNLAECALQLPEMENAGSLTAAWDGLVSSVDEDTYLAARWWLLTSHWGHLHHLASPSHLAAIAHLAIRSLAPASSAYLPRLDQQTEGETPAAVTGCHVTCDSVTRKFLTSTAIEGGMPLFSALVSALWDLVSMETSPTLSKGKKMKRSPGAALLHQTWTLLAQREDSKLHQSSGEAVPEVGSTILQLMELWPLSDVTLPSTTCHTVFQVLAAIHFESLGRHDQLRCMLGMLAVVVALTSDLARGGEGVEQAVARLGEVVAVGGRAPLFRCVPPSPLLQWCLRLLEQLQRQGGSPELGERVKGLLQNLCHSLTWDAAALRQVLPFVEQLGSQAVTPGRKRRKAGEELSESPRLVLSACLLQQLHRSLSRGYLPDGVREESEKLFKILAEPVTRQLQGVGERLPPSAVSCAQTLLQRRRLAAEKDGMAAATEVPAFLPRILEQVLGQLQAVVKSGALEISMEECNSVLACLQFVQAVCRSNSFLPSFLSQDMVTRCWSTLHRLLTLLQAQSSLPETLDLQFQSDYDLQAEMLESSRNASSAMQMNGERQTLNGEDESGVRKNSRRNKHHDALESSMEVDEEETDFNKRNSLIGNGLGHVSQSETAASSCLTDSASDLEPSQDSLSERKNVVLSLVQEQTANFGKQGSQEATKPLWQKGKKPSTKFSSSSAMVETVDRPAGTSTLSQLWPDRGGSSESGKRGEVVECLQTTLVDVLCVCNPDSFQTILDSLQLHLTVEGARTSVSGLLSSLQLWHCLATASLPDSLAPLRSRATKTVMVELQRLGLSLQGLQDREMSVRLTVPVLHLQALLISRGKALMSGRCALLSLCTVAVVGMQDLSYGAVVAVCEAVYAVLNALLVHFPTHTLGCLSEFLPGLHKLLVLVVQYGSQERLASLPVSSPILSCSHLLTRLLLLLCSHRTEVCKVSTYVLSSYTSLVQHITLLPAVKRSLSAGLYCLLDACDKFGIAQLFASLPVGSREIFRSLHADYTKYHKFKGKI